jgi:ELWxxDGT repeat protein
MPHPRRRSCAAVVGIGLLLGSVAHAAGPAYRVKDIWAGGIGSTPYALTNVDGRLYFGAQAPLIGTEPWTSDGTEAGTVLLVDLLPGGATASSYPTEFVGLNGMLFFAATGPGGPGLWRSDGTPGSAVQVPGPASPSSLTVIGGRLFFNAYTDQAWVSDGTDAGTLELVHIPGATSCTPMFCVYIGSYPTSFVTLNGTVLFAADAGSSIWQTDGTPSGTSLVATIGPGYIDSYEPRDFLTPLGDAVYFHSTDMAGIELWKSDGTGGGTMRVADINPTGDSSPGGITAALGAVFFAATEPGTGNELWRSDGTSAGTTQVADINPGPAGSYPGFNTFRTNRFVAVNGNIYFPAGTAGAGRELWKSDGTPGGTSIVADINPGPADANPDHLTAVNGTLFFTADDGTHGVELWKTDGTAAGTVRLTDIFPGSGSASPAELTLVGRRLFFTASDPEAGNELWAIDCPTDTECACAPLAVKATVTRLGAPAGDERLRLRGELVVPTSPPLDPVANGLRVVLAGSGGGTILDTTLPGGFDPVTRAGWAVRPTGWRYTSEDRTFRVTVTLRPAPGQLLVSVVARNQALSVGPAALPLTVRLDLNPVHAATVQCGELTFDPSACRLGGGTRLTCR